MLFRFQIKKVVLVKPTANLALYISEHGFKTLLIDLDPQANATSGIGINIDQIDHSIYDVISNDEKVETAFIQHHLKIFTYCHHQTPAVVLSYPPLFHVKQF